MSAHLTIGPILFHWDADKNVTFTFVLPMKRRLKKSISVKSFALNGHRFLNSIIAKLPNV